MKNILSFILALCLCVCTMAFAVSCNEGEPEQTEPTEAPTEAPTEKPTDPPAPAGVSAEDWSKMISQDAFENYTVAMEGKMTVDDGGEEIVSNVKSITKFTSTQAEFSVFEVGENGVVVGEPNVTLFEGEYAEIQKVQDMALLLAILEKFENFTYDAQKDVYIVEETVTVETILKAVGYEPDPVGGGFVPVAYDLPTTIIIKDAEVTISENGELLKLVCDYTQIMKEGGNEFSTSGLTTWTFSDYGTTVID